MICVQRTQRPTQLSDEVAAHLTSQFLQNHKKSVWKQPYIENALLEMSHGKCSYCEVDLTHESNYMQIDHFKCKSLYPEEVVKWENLLPACQHCNANKHAHDVIAFPIIDPTRSTPKEHIKMHCYFLLGRDALGKMTIETLHLNDLKRLTEARFLIGSSVYEKLAMVRVSTEQFLNEQDRNNSIYRYRIRNAIRELLLLAQPNKEYSATVATALLGNDDYKYIRGILVQYNIWDDEFNTLEECAKASDLGG